MDPATLALIGLGVGTATGAYGAYQQVISQNKALEFQASIADFNADLALEEGALIKEFAFINEAKFRRSTDQLLSAQTAQAGASGLVPEFGSLKELTDYSELTAELDALAIRYEGELGAYKKEMEAAFAQYQADIYRAAKQSPEQAAFLSFLSSGAKGLASGAFS